MELKKLHEARQKQFADNNDRMEEHARREREAHMTLIRTQKEADETERRQMAERRGQFLNYKRELNRQMSQNHEVRVNDKHA